MPKDVFETILGILFYIFLILLVIQIVLKLSGNSPAIDTIFATTLILIVNYLLKTSKFIGKTEAFMEHSNKFMENSKESFKKISEDMNDIRKKLKI